MNCEGTLVKAPLASRRKIAPPTLQQCWQPSIEVVQLQTQVEDQESGSGEMEYEGEHRWTTRDGTVIARVEQCLVGSDRISVEIEELASLPGPGDLGSDCEADFEVREEEKGWEDF